MFYCCSTSVPLFRNDCSSVPPSEDALFPHQMFHCLTIPILRFAIGGSTNSHLSSTVPLFPDQMFYCFMRRLQFHHDCSTVPHSLFHCFTIRCSTVPPSYVSLFHHNCSTVPPSDVLLFHHLCSTVPPSDVPMFHYQTFQCLSITCSTVPR